MISYIKKGQSRHTANFLRQLKDFYYNLKFNFLEYLNKGRYKTIENYIIEQCREFLSVERDRDRIRI